MFPSDPQTIAKLERLDHAIDHAAARQSEVAKATAEIARQVVDLSHRLDRLVQITAAARAPAPWVIN
jgi:hypothetical protein